MLPREKQRHDNTRSTVVAARAQYVFSPWQNDFSQSMSHIVGVPKACVAQWLTHSTRNEKIKLGRC
jgi:hypothetical protein